MILLDTVALIRLITVQSFKRTAMARVIEAEASDKLFVSAISAWELCLIENRAPSGELIDGDGAAFFTKATTGTALTAIPVDTEIAIESRRLPDRFNQDPADRFIVATARKHRLTIVTTDRIMLDYAKLGHVDAIAC